MNNLPDQVINAPSLNSFKNRLDKFWQNQDGLYNPEYDIVPLPTGKWNIALSDNEDLDIEA